jgi:ketosteroid isomerase-like protein
MAKGDPETLQDALERAGTDPEAFYAILDPDVEWDTTRQVPDGEVTRGVASVRRFFHTWQGHLVDYMFDWEALAHTGDTVYGVLHHTARGRGSGAPVESRIAQIWTFRRGKVVRYRGFQDEAEARRAAGLAD